MTVGVGPSGNHFLRSRPGPVSARRADQYGRAVRHFALRSDGARRGLDGLRHASYVGDLDLVRFGLLGHGDSDREHAVVIDGANVVEVQALAEEQLPAELAVARSSTCTSSVLSQNAVRVALTFRRPFSTVSSIEPGSAPGRSSSTFSSSPRR